jgi:hypothetical protein
MLRIDLRRSPVKHVEGELHVNAVQKAKSGSSIPLNVLGGHRWPSTAAGTFRIVPSDFLALDDLMAGRSVPSAGFEIRWLSKNSQTQIIARDVASIPEAKTFCKWRLSRLESKTLPATGE